MDGFLEKMNVHLRKDQIIHNELEDDEEENLSPLPPPENYTSERLPFNDYQPTYVDDVTKILYDVRTQISTLLSENIFIEITKKNSKMGAKVARLLDDIRSHQYEIDRTIDVVEMEKKLVDHELTLFRKYLADREEMILNSLYREQTLERQLQQLRREMSLINKSQMRTSKPPKNRDEKSEIMNKYGEILQEHMIDEWIGSMTKFKNLEISHELLSRESNYMKDAISKKMTVLEDTRSEYDKKIKVKDDLLKDLRKKINKKSSNYSKREIKEFESKIRNLEKEVESIEKEKNMKLMKVNENITSLQTKYDAVVSELLEKERLLKKYADIKDQEDENFPKDKVVIVFTDIQSSSELWETSVDGMIKALRIHNESIREIIPKYRGYEVKTEGDAFMIAFHSCFDAVNFAVTTQVELMEKDWPEFVYSTPSGKEEKDRRGNLIWRGLRLRMGIHMGLTSQGLFHQMDPVTRRCDYFGPPVNRAARVEGTACGGEICVSSDVWDEIKSIFKKLDYECVVYELGEFKLKGMEENAELIRSIFPKDLVGRRASLERRKVLPWNHEESEGEGTTDKDKSGRPPLEREGSMTGFDGEGISSEKRKILVEHQEVYHKLLYERIKNQKKQVNDMIQRMDNMFRNPALNTQNAQDVIRRTRGNLNSGTKQIMDNMKEFRSFLTIGEPLTSEDRNRLQDEYKDVRKKNHVKKRKESVKARYMDIHKFSSGRRGGVNPREATLKKKLGFNMRSSKRNRRISGLDSSSNLDFDSDSLIQTSMPGMGVGEGIFDKKFSRPKTGEEEQQQKNQFLTPGGNQRGMKRTNTLAFDQRVSDFFKENAVSGNINMMSKVQTADNIQFIEAPTADISIQLPDIHNGKKKSNFNSLSSANSSSSSISSSSSSSSSSSNNKKMMNNKKKQKSHGRSKSGGSLSKSLTKSSSSDNRKRTLKKSMSRNNMKRTRNRGSNNNNNNGGSSSRSSSRGSTHKRRGLTVVKSLDNLKLNM